MAQTVWLCLNRINLCDIEKISSYFVACSNVSCKGEIRVSSLIFDIVQLYFCANLAANRSCERLCKDLPFGCLYAHKQQDTARFFSGDPEADTLVSAGYRCHLAIYVVNHNAMEQKWQCHLNYCHHGFIHNIFDQCCHACLCFTVVARCYYHY